MKSVSAPIIRKVFRDKIGKTAIEVNYNGDLITVWANGNVEGSGALIVNFVVNEVGDTFTATVDSKTLDDKGKPVYLKGDKVTRNKQGYEFKSLVGAGAPTEFVQAASVFNLPLQVVNQ